jgi:hypothetical protein
MLALTYSLTNTPSTLRAARALSTRYVASFAISKSDASSSRSATNPPLRVKTTLSRSDTPRSAPACASRCVISRSSPLGVGLTC